MAQPGLLSSSGYLSGPFLPRRLHPEYGTPESFAEDRWPRDAYQLGRIERQLEKTDLLILDELSYMSFNKYESELLFKVISERSERSSTIVTTNLSFFEWTQLFENTTMVAALVDRLTYRSHVLDMSGPSFRLMTAQAEIEAVTTAGNTAG